FNRRWSTEFKQRLHDSRIRSTENCVAAITRHPKRGDGSPRVLLNASAVGIYGPRGDEEVDESTPAGDDFLAKLCIDWDHAAQPRGACAGGWYALASSSTATAGR